MLVLMRREDESLRIGDSIKMTVLEIKGNRVRLGIDAPRHVSVHREKIYKKIKNEKRQYLYKRIFM